VAPATAAPLTSAMKACRLTPTHPDGYARRVRNVKVDEPNIRMGVH